MAEKAKLVLVVDDDEVERFLLRHALEQKGFAVEEAECVDDALLCFQVAQPDALVTDLCLPGPSGIDLCQTIRSKAEHAAIPVVVMTGNRNPLARQQASDAGADLYLLKTPDPAPMVDAIATLLAH